MPKKGWTTVTIAMAVYERMLKFIEKENEKAGYKKYRSASQLAEEALAKLLKEAQEQNAE